jgi:tRNA nucleotidyltransferase (CCA-adding enzyme)
MHRVAVIAARHGRRVWLVGGPVRDLLLGREIIDLDLAVDGAVQEIGLAAAREFGGEFRWHPRFLTSTISFAGGHLDLAGTRTETYSAAAVLPRVRPGKIDADLARRDFSINAMALEIRPRGYGELIDPFGGRSDLRSGALRVLHDDSFSDDPTRGFRAARFAARFGFHTDRTTARLLRASVARGDPQLLSGERVAAELRRALNEQRPAAVLALLGRWRLGAAWGAPESPTTNGLGRLRYAGARLKSFRLDTREEVALRLACAFHDLPRQQRERIAERLRVRRIERRFLVRGPEQAREILKRLRDASGRVAVSRVCRNANAHFLTLAGLLADASGFGKLRRWLATRQT